MAQYNAIKAAVNAYIKANGRKEITGQILNSVLNATIDSLGRFFQFAGEARPDTDPGTPDQNVTYLAGVPGTYTHFNGLVIDEQEIALLMWNGSWVKHTMLIGIREVVASVDNQVGTPSVDVNYDNAELSLAFHNMKGDPGTPGAAAGFGSVTADVDANIGTPGVSVETSGLNTAKNFTFHFTNLKGQKGDTGVTAVTASVDNNTGVPYVEASLSGQTLVLAFHNMKGQQGDTGSSVDYPYTLVNNVTTDDATQGLSAAMGVYLQAKIDQLEHDVDGFAELRLFYEDAYIKTGTYVGTTINVNTSVAKASCNCYWAECSEGDVVTINGTGGQDDRLWAFLDADYKLLSVSSADVTESNLEVTAPTNAKYVIINDNSGSTSYITYKSNFTKDRIDLKELNAVVLPFSNIIGGYINYTSKLYYTAPANNKMLRFPVVPGKKYTLFVGLSSLHSDSYIVWVDSNLDTIGTRVAYVLGENELTAPFGAEYIIVDAVFNGNGNIKDFCLYENTGRIERIETKLNTIEEGAEVNDLNTASISSSDLTFVDENGNMLAEFISGHIKTKNFDSSKSAKKIKILCIGNSWTCDTFNYVGALLNEILANELIDLHIGICYDGGSSLADHYDNLENNADYDFYEWTNTGESWTKSTKAINTILALDNWDVVILQQLSFSSANYATYQPYLNDCLDIISERVQSPVKFGWNLVRERTDAPLTDFSDIVDCAERLLRESLIQFVMPSGTAIENARTTALDSIGAGGHLTYDGSHLQEGLPCLIEAYSATLFLLSLYGYGSKGINGTQFRPTQEWVTAHGMSGQANGTSVGVTESNVVLAKKCSTIAVNNPYVVTDCSNL